MRLGKQRGPYSKDAMPIGPHRTHTVPVNVADLERVFDDGAEVTLEAMIDKRLIKNTRTDVKVLGNGELKKKMAVTAHAFSTSAREKIEAAGGSAIALRGESAPNSRTRRKPSGGETPQTASEGSVGATGASNHENTTTPEA
jgi:ribosomal protein L18E